MNRIQTLARILTLVLLATIPPTLMNAQDEMKIHWGDFHGERQYINILKERIASVKTARKENLHVVPASEIADKTLFLWDGQQVCLLGFGDTDNVRPLCIFKKEEKPLYTLLTKKGKQGTTLTVKEHAGWKATLEEYGPWRVLVLRNEKGAAQDCFTVSDWDDVANFHHVQQLSMHDLLDGVYETEDGKKVVFGPIMDHYADLGTSRDPGFYFFNMKEDFGLTNTLSYGANRVSRGDPSSPKYGKMPGGGGAGAVMGPMEWSVEPIPMGLHVKVMNDEPFVSHYPSLGSGEVQLKKVQDPFDLGGCLAVASVRPLAKGMLRMLPKGDLSLMSNEILNRHADGTKPTAIEQLNLGLIYALLNE